MIGLAQLGLCEAPEIPCPRRPAVEGSVRARTILGMRLERLGFIALACAIISGCVGAGNSAPSPAPATLAPSASPVLAQASGGSPSPTAAPECDPTGEQPWTEFTFGTATFTGDDGKIDATLSLTANGTFLPRYDPSCPAGAQAEWASASDQWHLTVLSNTGPNDAFGGQWASLWIEDYGPEPPLHADGTPCTITITEVSVAGLVGRAECPGMRWLNEYEAEMNPDASPLPEYEPFDLSILFEARP